MVMAASGDNRQSGAAQVWGAPLASPHTLAERILTFLICSMRSPAPTNTLSTKLRELGETWLSLRCTSSTTQIPMKMMAESYGTHRSLGEVLTKLRCRQCGQAPDRIELTDDSTRNASGKERNTGAWAIDLSQYAGPRDAAKFCKQVGR